MAQGAKGRSRQADPSGQSTNQTRSEHVKGTGGKIKLLRELLNTLAAAQALNPRGAADVPPPTGDEIFSVPPDYVS